MEYTKQQEKVIESDVKDLVVSASAGSGKTFVVIEKLIGLICDKKVPVEKLLVLTFTKAASNEMKNRLYNAILEKPSSKFLIEQIDSLPLSDISTIDSFCEKIIKRNINKLDLDENFTILDEKSAKNLKKLAFNRTFQHFSQNNKDEFEEIYFAFKRNKQAVQECVFAVQDYLSSCKNQEKLLGDFENKISEYDEIAKKDLKQIILNNLKNAKLCLDKLNETQFAINEKNIISKLKDFCIEDFDSDIFEISKKINSFLPLPAFRGKIDKQVKEILNKAREQIKDCLKITLQLGCATENMKSLCNAGVLVKAIISFYKYYVKLYSSLKSKKDGLDFADIEFYAKTLLEDEDIKKALQEKYDYIFIDEYQDTNRLQQAILKPIAQGGHFVAVGDIKQGIYGFRNASMEIMQEDIAQFPKSESGEALSLTGNFRTDKNILDFVNVVFEKVMTLESVGIDYEGTSKLEGLRHFEEGRMPSVCVDIVLKSKPSEEDDESQEDEAKVYSVKDHIIKNDPSLTNEILAIQNRIEQALQSEIYDAKREQYRKVNLSDIALLFRGRSTLMKETFKFLSKKGFPINADIKQSLLDDGEIGVIYSLLKLTLNMHDDIALASALNSQFGQMSVQEMADLRLESEEKSNFYEIFEKSTNEKVVKFKDLISTLSFEVQVFGITKALNRLFNKFDYYNYLYSLDDSHEKISNINSLFKIIRSGQLDRNVCGLINQLEGVQEIMTGGSGNAITMTTIHATKGLEYPIVILCECGESLTKSYPKSYVISEKYGFASYLNDFENLIRIPSPAFIAGKMGKHEREFVDEIMIFYVAMTRAQNHLFIIGSGKEKDFTFESIKDQNSYFKMIFYALGENLTSQIFSQEHLVKGKWEFNVFDQFEDRIIKEEKDEKAESLFKDEIENYRNFNYTNKEQCYLNFKNSVTSAMKLNQEESLSQSGEMASQSSQTAIDKGNAYHEALKYLDFDKIDNIDDLRAELKIIEDKLSEGYLALIDEDVIFKNIMQIKKLTKGCKLYKEKEFIMQASLEDIGFENGGEDDNVIVQGIVDLFATGEEIILVDYKYSSQNAEVLKQRYGKQIHLYAQALEKAFNKKIEKTFLLSLKNAEIIKV